MGNLLESIAPVKEKYPYFRWIPEENLHITLAFLGEMDQRDLPQIIKAAENTAGHGIINAGGGKLFTLPKGRAANVLVFGFDKGTEKMQFLAAEIRKNLHERGILLSRDVPYFMPHITVARRNFRADNKINELRINKEDAQISAEGDIITLCVFESILSGRGASYNCLAAFPLDAVPLP